MINEIQELNFQLIKANNINPEELQKQELIKQILSKKNCFLRMNIEDAYLILKDLKIPDDKIKAVYFKLIDLEK